MQRQWQPTPLDRIRAGILHSMGLVNIAGLQLLKPDGTRTEPISIHPDFVGYFRITGELVIIVGHDDTVWVGVPECLTKEALQYCPEGESDILPDPTDGGKFTLDQRDLLARVQDQFCTPKSSDGPFT